MIVNVLDSSSCDSSPTGQNPRLSHARTFRVGFITPKRIGGSVVRNRVRRRLREVVRRHQREIAKGRWIVTVARGKAARASYIELEDEWLRLVKRASILAP
jgi:ribonuclease P protein component